MLYRKVVRGQILQSYLCGLKNNSVSDLLSHILSTINLFEMSPIK